MLITYRPVDSKLSVSEQAVAEFERFFHSRSKPVVLSVPGRVNLIGEHIDYHNLPVLPIAIQKQITIAFLPRKNAQICAKSTVFADSVTFALNAAFASGGRGHWGNYVRAAAHAIGTRQSLRNGIDACIASDLPSAAGLSSSSALLIAVSLALLQANRIDMSLNELTSILPEGEQLVGTRGGAMDHVALLASRAGFATLIKSFEPLAIDYVRIPSGWRFLVAHSLVTAEKSGSLAAEYNHRRAAGTRALRKLGLSSYSEAISSSYAHGTPALSEEAERDAFVHVTGEARRVLESVGAIRAGDLTYFGRLLYESHVSLRDRVRVSLPEVDTLVDAALDAGAAGARLTGAGFGGCVVCLCTTETIERLRKGIWRTYYRQRQSFDPANHLFVAEPFQGALSPKPPDDTNQH